MMVHLKRALSIASVLALLAASAHATATIPNPSYLITSASARKAASRAIRADLALRNITAPKRINLRVWTGNTGIIGPVNEYVVTNPSRLVGYKVQVNLMKHYKGQRAQIVWSPPIIETFHP